MLKVPSQFGMYSRRTLGPFNGVTSHQLSHSVQKSASLSPERQGNFSLLVPQVNLVMVGKSEAM